MTATLRTKVWLTARVVKASFINIATGKGSQLRQSFHEGARGIEFSYGGGVLKGRGSLEAGTVVLSLC